jgi:hypothetical protein
MADEFLYDDGNIAVRYFPGFNDEHLLCFSLPNSTHDFPLRRGVLEELARTKPKDLRNKLNTVHPYLRSAMMLAFYPDSSTVGIDSKEMDVLYRDVSIALCQARVKELEEMMKDGGYLGNSLSRLGRGDATVLKSHSLPKVIPVPEGAR